MLHYQLNYQTKSRLLNFDVQKSFDQVVKLITEIQRIKIDLWFDVVFVNRKQMQKINHQFRHKNQATDVISFAFWDNQKIQTPLLGEIYLCPEYINEVALEDKIPFKHNLIMNFIHGVLHLLQFDHQTKKQAAIMFKKQNKIFQQLKI